MTSSSATAREGFGAGAGSIRERNEARSSPKQATSGVRALAVESRCCFSAGTPPATRYAPHSHPFDAMAELLIFRSVEWGAFFLPATHAHSRRISQPRHVRRALRGRRAVLGGRAPAGAGDFPRADDAAALAALRVLVCGDDVQSAAARRDHRARGRRRRGGGAARPVGF